ncbi:MAG TPA: CpsD/CapB family tyrosine-protein kinase [Terracidiphilus sp.]|nr:CpsD/CapB family tyrosine-protein kinase [Terracidiphilus sp.]
MRAERGAPPISWPDLSSLNEAEGVPAMEHPDVLSRFPSLECSIPPQSRLVFLTDRESPAAEAIRLLGVRLRDMRQNRPLKKLLITSTIPQEGKSMISANLACALADGSDARVLLLEGDLRRPSLMQMFGLKKQPGICEWLQNDNGTAANICHLRNAGIWILSAGSTSSNLNEHLQPQRLETKMNEVAQWFDWIIIDSSPTLPLADTSVWMRLADGILLVTRQGTTEKQQLMKGLDALEQEKVIGAIVNGSKAAAYSGYYYRSSITSE